MPCPLADIDNQFLQLSSLAPPDSRQLRPCAGDFEVGRTVDTAVCVPVPATGAEWDEEKRFLARI